MKSLKPLLKSRYLRYLLVGMIGCYIRLVFLTARTRQIIHPEAMPYMRGEAHAIFACWHGRMMMMPYLRPPTRRLHVLISLHRDGVLISEVIKAFHLQTIHGSSNKNGRSALMAMLRILKRGENVAITPDGPRGPFQQAASGVAAAARLSGAPIIPVAFSASRHRRATSWDRFMLVLPFSRIIFCVGAPMMIDTSIPLDAARCAVEQAINEQTERADAALL